MLNTNFQVFVVLEISPQTTDRQTDIQDIARSTRLVILIKNIYTIHGRKRFLLPLL